MIDSGLLNIYKPSGLTSFQVVRVVREILQVKKVGHCGTLDPLAEGVLLVCFGKATKYTRFFLGEKKVYRARMVLGIATATGDKEGQIIRQENLRPPSESQIKEVFTRFLGEVEQVPPRYAALKYQGKKYYEYARAGIDFPRPARKINIYHFDLLEYTFPYLTFTLGCSAGTYVRSLVEDVAAGLGSCGSLDNLVRESVGGFSADKAIPWEEIKEISDEKLFRKATPLAEMLELINPDADIEKAFLK